MRLTCDPAKGGCGKSLVLDQQALTAIWSAYRQERELDCPTDGCARKLTHRQIKDLVEAVEKSYKSGTNQGSSLHIEVKDVPNPGRAYGQGRV